MNVIHIAAHGAFIVLLGLLVGRVASILRARSSTVPNERRWDILLAIALPTVGVVAVILGLALRDGTAPLITVSMLSRVGLAAAVGVVALVAVPSGIGRAVALATAGWATTAAVFDARFSDDGWPKGSAVLLVGVAIGLLLPTKVMTRRPIVFGLLAILIIAVTTVAGVGTGNCSSCARLGIGLFGIEIQAFAIAKTFLAIAVAGLMAVPAQRRLGPGPIASVGQAPWRKIVVLTGISAGLWVFGRDLGPAVIVSLLVLCLLLLAYLPEHRRVVLGVSAIFVLYGVPVALAAFSHFRERTWAIIGWSEPIEQLVQAWYAMANGGIFGQTLGRGRLAAVPVVQTDMALAALGNELGLVGVLLVLALPAVFTLTCFEIARRQLLRGNPQEGFLAAALGLLPAVQTFVIVGGTLGLFTLTGVNLPGVSKGGSDLLALGFALGCVLRIARRPILPRRPPVAAEEMVARDLERAPLLVGFAFAPLVIGLVYRMVIQAPALNSEQTPLGGIPNPRAVEAAIARLHRAEGARIFARDGKTELASVGPTGFVLARANTACALGLPNPDGTPLGGLAERWLPVMAGDGNSDDGIWDRFTRTVNGRGSRMDVITTIDPLFQQIAVDSLLNSTAEGAIVVLDRDGGVVAMACAPFATPSDVVETRQRAEVLRDPSGRFLPRATMGLYACGSVCKIVTYTTALAEGTVEPGSRISYPNGAPCPHSQVIGGVTFDSPYYCGTSSITTRQAFSVSDNLLTAILGLKVGRVALERNARVLGFWQPAVADVPSAVSTLWTDRCPATGDQDLAWTAYGQGCIQVTPSQVAALSLPALRGDGVVPRLHMVKALRPTASNDEKVVAPPVADKMASSTAMGLRVLMVDAVANGWARPADHPTLEVGGKTGTAEYPNGASRTHAWYTGWFQRSSTDLISEGYALAVLLAGGGEGMRAAGVAGEVTGSWYMQSRRYP